jgi:serine/threonine protein kinase/ActR/RegA family two-component response regulator
MARILVVDDDLELLDTIDERFSAEEHSVTVASSGQAGWENLQKNEYDLVILDWDMPELTGIEVLRKFRAGGGKTPVIMLTGHTSVDDKESGLDSGADDYVTKPFSIRELSARVRSKLKSVAELTAPPPPLGQGNEEVLKRGDLLGTRLAANYEFLELLGEGGAGFVFKARHPRLNRLVAVKMLRAADLKEVSISRFEREAQAVSQVNHYNVVTVYDYGVTERQRPYLVMEYIQGESLQEKIDREGPLPLAIASAIIIQACRGLQEVHALGIIHRDLKPDNIVLQRRPDRADWVKIVDFGIAHLQEGRQQRLTDEGSVVGTLFYIAPEILRAGSPDVRADIYSLGVILFEALTARPMFVAENAQELLIKAVTEEAPPPSRYRKEIAPGSALDDVVLKATNKDPNKRYQSAAEMREVLGKIQIELQSRRK